MPESSDRRQALASAMDEAARVALETRKNLVAELKPDGSIVTNADREVEIYLRRVLPKIAPGATVWGEEFGYAAPGEGGRWLVDPIDGTSNFRFGSPLWGISVALMVGDEIELGAIWLPDLNERYFAERNHGATLNGRPLPLIPAGSIRPEELVAIGDTAKRRTKSFPGKQRLAGAAVIDAAFFATQRYRAWIGANERLYDVAAGLLIGLELGADLVHLDGRPFAYADFYENRKLADPWALLPPACQIA